MILSKSGLFVTNNSGEFRLGALCRIHFPARLSNFVKKSLKMGSLCTKFTVLMRCLD
jgi:hypothetical protein